MNKLPEKVKKLSVLDTSAMIDHPGIIGDLLLEEDMVVCIPTFIIDELDHIKDTATGTKQYGARHALKEIFKHKDNKNLFTPVHDIPVKSSLSWMDLDMSRVDNVLIKTTYVLASSNKVDAVLITNDNGMRVKASIVKVNTKSTNNYNDDPYRGYRVVDMINGDLQGALIPIIDDLHINEYIIFKSDESETYDEVRRWDGNNLVRLKSPAGCSIDPKNHLQAMAIDLMYNLDIPIKVILGTYGSGKSYIATKTSEHMVNRLYYDKLMLVRNPVPAEGIDIGALPGEKMDKVGAYFKPMLQYLGDNFQEDKVICEIPSFMKGVSVDRTMMLVDECEDLSEKMIKTIGTRIGKGSAIVFMGDYKQAERNYIKDNGIMSFVKACKGSPLVGVVTLEDDVRSSVSKLFAEF